MSDAVLDIPLHAPPSSRRRPIPAADAVFLGAVSCLFLALTLWHIDAPGIYGDEVDKLAPTVQLLTGQPLSAAWWTTIFDVRVLLAFTERIGPVLSYLPLPFVWVLGCTPLALRLSSIACAWLTLIAAYDGAKRWCGAPAARAGILLTAVSPAYVFLQRMGSYNYGPVTLFIALAFACLARYSATRRPGALAVAALSAGLAIETALQAWFVLLPLAIIALLLWMPRPRIRVLAASLLVFLAVASPILILAWRSGAAFERLGWGGTGSAMSLARFSDTLATERMHFDAMLGGVDGVQFASVGNRHVENPWMRYAFYGSILLVAAACAIARRRLECLRSAAAPALVCVIALLLTGLIAKDPATYQLIAFWPFPLLAIGAGIGQIDRRSRLTAVVVTGLLAATQLHATITQHRLLAATRGRVLTSAQIYPLAQYLDGHRDLHPIAMDWGLQNQIFFLTSGRVRAEALHGWWPAHGTPPDDFGAALAKQFTDPHTVFVFLAPGEGFDRGPDVDRLARASGTVLRPDRTFYESDGTVAYRLLRPSP